MRSATSEKLSFMVKKVKMQELFFVSLSVILILILLSNSSGKGYEQGVANSCMCHGSESDTITIEMVGLPQEGYQPTTPYNLMATVTDSSLSSSTGGIWVKVDNGTLSTSDANLKLDGTDLVQSANTATSWNFTWTAPATGSGWVQLAIYGMVSDGVAKSGDSWNSTVYQINEIGGDTSPPPIVSPSSPNYESNIMTGVFLATVLFAGFIVIVFVIDHKARKK